MRQVFNQQVGRMLSLNKILLGLIIVFGSLMACSEDKFRGRGLAFLGVDKPEEQKADADAIIDPPANEEPGPSQSPTVTPSPLPPPPMVPQFALLVNDLKCGLCHVKVNGDIISTSNVRGLYDYSKAEINGNWYAAGAWEATKLDPPSTDAAKIPRINFAPGKQMFQNHNGSNMPKDLDKDGLPDFPKIDYARAARNAKGSLSAGGVDYSPVIPGDALKGIHLYGTIDNPISISGDIVVENGDLIIHGYYQGVGTIYVATGNIYIPSDLIAKNSAFPFTGTNDAELMKEAADAIVAKKDGLALAVARSIFIGDLEDYGVTTKVIPNPDTTSATPTITVTVPNNSLFVSPLSPPQLKANIIGVHHVYDWFPGGKTEFEKLYQPSPISCDNYPKDRIFRANNAKSVSLVESYLYAGNTIAGRANHNSFSINGGVIADHFHYIMATPECGPGIHPVNKQDQQWSHINFDYRMKLNFPLLQELNVYFEQ